MDLLTFAIFGSFTWFVILGAVFIVALFISEGSEHGGIAFLSAVVFFLTIGGVIFH